MEYEYIRYLSGMAGMLVFIALFSTVIILTFRPKNKKKLEEHALIPFKEEQ